jgi:hypothetical protein
MVMLKGVTLHSTLQFNREMLGEETVNKFISQLDEQSRNILSQTILDTSWYPFDCLISFTELVFNTILQKNEDTLKKGARLIVEKQVKGIYKTLLSVGSTEFIVKRINSINERYYQGIEVKTEYLDTTKLKVKYLGFEKKHRLHEIITMGWWEVVFENLDAKNVTTNLTTSLAEGKGYFEFTVTWEKK